MKYLYILLILSIFGCEEKSLDEKILENKKELVEELSKMVDDDQLYRNIMSSLDKKIIGKTLFTKKYDSLWVLQSKVDSINTERLIEITKKYGFPNPDRLDEPIGTWVIFQHSPSFFFNKLEVLLKKENEEKRLFDNEYNMLKWHLGGRKGIPFIPDVEVIDSRARNLDSINNKK